MHADDMTILGSIDSIHDYISMYIVYSYVCVDLLSKTIILYLQEECVRLVNATIRGDVEVVSTLISDGVDMNVIIHEVCIMASCFVYLY